MRGSRLHLEVRSHRILTQGQRHNALQYLLFQVQNNPTWPALNATGFLLSYENPLY